MKPAAVASLVAVFTCMSVSLTTAAQQSRVLTYEELLAKWQGIHSGPISQEDAPKNCTASLLESARADRWQAQREQIIYLRPISFEKQTDLYRSLIRGLFDVSPEERAAIVIHVLPVTFLNELTLADPTTDFTAELVRVLSRHYTRDIVLKKLNAFADLHAIKLAQ